MIYRQILEKEDYKSTVVWEFVIGEKYSELIAGAEAVEIQEVDIFTFDSVKFDAEDKELRQKEDEFAFTMNEAIVRTEADSAASQLMKESHIKDIWTALFLHKKGEYETSSRKAENLVFSGLVRKEANAEDQFWNGEDWDNAIQPLRTWQYKSQSFGEAVLDNVNLASMKVGENIIPGLLDQVDIDGLISDVEVTDAIQTPNERLNPLILYGDRNFTKSVHLNSLLNELIAKTVERKQNAIPDFCIETVESLSGYTFGRKNRDNKEINAYKFRLFANDTDGLRIDSRLIKPIMNEDGITPRADYNMAWHRFNRLTDLLYSLATFFGNQLRIRTIDKGKIQLEFVRLNSAYGKAVEVLDATSGQYDLFTITDNSEVYAAKATDINTEGQDVNMVEGTHPDHYAVRLRELPKLPEAEKLLPLSVSETWQGFHTDRPVHANMPWLTLVHQNCETGSDDFLKRYEMAWTGLIVKNSDGAKYSIINRVASTIGKRGKWYSRIGDCINQRVKDRKKDIGRNYQIEVPFINAVRSERGVGAKNVQLFDRIELDGATYFITGIEINPMDSKVKLKLTSTNQYKIYEDPTEEVNDGNNTGSGSGGTPTYNSPVGFPMQKTGEDIAKGDLICWDKESHTIKKYRNIVKYYGSFGAVAYNSAKAGESVAVVNEGTFKDETLNLTPGKPVFARYNSELNKCVPSSVRLTNRTEEEQIDVEIGTAKSPTEWELMLPAKECEII